MSSWLALYSVPEISALQLISWVLCWIFLYKTLHLLFCTSHIQSTEPVLTSVDVWFSGLRMITWACLFSYERFPVFLTSHNIFTNNKLTSCALFWLSFAHSMTFNLKIWKDLIFITHTLLPLLEVINTWLQLVPTRNERGTTKFLL